MLNYSDVSIIEQNFASGTENVNPFAVISWIGTIWLHHQQMIGLMRLDSQKQPQILKVILLHKQ